MIRFALLLVALIAAGQARAGSAVPPPRAIHAVQPALATATPLHLAQHAWRDTPPVLQGWSSDRYVAVMNGCEGPSLAADGDGDFADADPDFGGGYVVPLWGNMQ